MSFFFDCVVELVGLVVIGRHGWGYLLVGIFEELIEGAVDLYSRLP